MQIVHQFAKSLYSPAPLYLLPAPPQLLLLSPGSALALRPPLALSLPAAPALQPVEDMDLLSHFPTIEELDAELEPLRQKIEEGYRRLAELRRQRPAWLRS